MDKLRYFSLCLFIAATASCRKPYNPPAIKSTGSYLVVEGVIVAGTDSTVIKLSRTVKLSNNNAVNPETGAIVTVESNQGTAYPLTEISPGNYAAPPLGLSITNQYRLRIKTVANESYLSDFVPVSVTPAIDSIGFNIVNDPVVGIQIYVNAHDLTDSTKYFRWDYEETWGFHSKYVSYWIAEDGELVPRTAAQNIFTCYASSPSSDIVLNSSARLKQDELYQAPIAFIPSTSEKLEFKYSILLHQYALTADAYGFWTNLKTSSEQLGSIFDAQPSQLPTNIHNLTNQNSVIGYVSACTVATKRIIITDRELPIWQATYPYQCEQDSAKTGYDIYNDLIYGKHTLLATGPPAGSPPSYLLFSTVPCVDCTIRGTTTVPLFFQ